jgi:predicted porin
MQAVKRNLARRASFQLGKLTFAFVLATSLMDESARAQSSLQLLGQVDEWVGLQQMPTKAVSSQNGSGGMSESYFALHGDDELGANWKALFVLEAFFTPQNGQYGRFLGDSFFARDAYVGMESPYGTVTAGRVTNPLFISTILFNPFVDSYTFSPMVFQTYLGQGTFPQYATDQGVIGDSGWDNSISYATPNFSGLTGTVQYAFGNEPGNAGAHKASAQVLYLNGSVGATLVYQYVNFNTQPLDLNNPATTSTVPGLRNQQVVQVGLSYDFKVVKFFGQYMQTMNAVTPTSFTVHTGQLGVSIPVRVGALLASYARSTDSGGMQQERNTWSVGYDYPVSSRTDLYVAFMRDQFVGETSGKTVGAGIRTKF